MAQFEVKDGVGIIPEGTTVMKDDGFKDCTELTSVVIPESVTDIYNRCFENCYNLSRIEVAAGNKDLFRQRYGGNGHRMPLQNIWTRIFKVGSRMW